MPPRIALRRLLLSDPGPCPFPGPGALRSFLQPRQMNPLARIRQIEPRFERPPASRSFRLLCPADGVRRRSSPLPERAGRALPLPWTARRIHTAPPDAGPTLPQKALTSPPGRQTTGFRLAVFYRREQGRQAPVIGPNGRYGLPALGCGLFRSQFRQHSHQAAFQPRLVRLALGLRAICL